MCREPEKPVGRPQTNLVVDGPELLHGLHVGDGDEVLSPGVSLVVPGEPESPGLGEAVVRPGDVGRDLDGVGPARGGETEVDPLVSGHRGVVKTSRAIRLHKLHSLAFGLLG